MNTPHIIHVAEDDTVALYRVRSDSNPNISYGVDIDKQEGTVFCDCPDFRFRKQTEKYGGANINDKRNHCKHITEILKIRMDDVPVYHMLAVAEVLMDG